MSPDGEIGHPEVAVTSAASSHLAYHATHSPWMVAFVTTLATFMQVLDTTIVNVALPHIAGNLGADVSDSTWILTAYLVANGIVLPVSSWFSSLMGRRNFYLLCVAVFTFSSFLCGIAPTFGILVLCRILQGIGGGGLQPITQAILVDAFPPQKRGMAMAMFGMTVVAAPVVGPTLGGWLTDNFDWRWIFFINIPIGVMSFLLALQYVTDPPYMARIGGKKGFHVDYLGLGLLSIGLGSLQLVLDLGERDGWFASPFIVVFSFVAFATLLLAIVWEYFSEDPVLELRLLRDRNLFLSTLTMLIFGVALYSSTVLLPLLMQTLLGYTAMLSGLAISPGGLIIMVLMPFIGWMLSRFDARKMVAFGILMMCFGMFEMGRLSLDAPFGELVWVRILQSFGLAFIFVPVNTLAFSYVAAAKRNSASSLITLTRNIGGSMGIALASTIVTRQSQAHQVFMTDRLTALDANFQAVTQQIGAYLSTLTNDPVAAAQQAQAVIYRALLTQSHMLGFLDAFQYTAFLSLPAIPIVLAMRRPHKETEHVVSE